MTTVIDDNGRISGGSPLDDIEEQLNQHALFWARKMREAIKPRAYENPQAITGGSRHGAVKRDPGYEKHLQVQRAKDGYEVTSSRPFVPEQSRRWLEQQDEEYLAWLVDHGD